MTTPEPPLQLRQQRLLDELERHGLDALLLNAGPSLTYLTGLHVQLSERPCVGIFQVEGPPLLILPELESGKLDALPFEARTYTYGEDPHAWPTVFRRAAEQARLDFRRVGVEPTRCRILELRLIEEAAPRAAYIDGEAAVSALRSQKDAGEIKRMEAAVDVAESALLDALPSIQAGTTERQLASELTARLLAGGSAPELPFSPIVAFGSATADPHAIPSDRPLRKGDLVLIDWGANVEGYRSDLTRMFCFGQPDDELAEIVSVVGSANEAARNAVRPGARFEDVDRAARSAIAAAGYGNRFIHRTGHGLGLETHERPYIREGNTELLQPGMTFTIEPGVYVPGRGGARIEDDILVTDDGVRSLTNLDRSLRILPV